jgi:hypothetical protein
VFTGTRTLTDALAAPTETVTRSFTGFRTIAENVAKPTDAVARAYSGFRSISESIAAPTDSINRLFTGFRTISENVVAPADTVTRAANYPRSIAEAVAAVTDSVSRVGVLARSISENVPAPTDSVNRNATYFRSLLENIGFPTDSVSRIYSPGGAVHLQLAIMIHDNFVALGAAGSNLYNMCDAIAVAILAHMTSSLVFTTVDTGNLGAGTGTGLGIFTLDATSMATAMVSAWGATGPNALSSALAISQAFLDYFAFMAKLTSVHPTIGNGAGVIGPGAFQGMIPVTAAAQMVTSFVTYGANPAAPNLSTFCSGICQAFIQQVQTIGTGSVVITGAGTVPGSGVGTGTVDPN